MKSPLKFIILMLLMINSAWAQTDKTQWVVIGEGTYEYGFIFPYKIKLLVPFGVRNIDEIKNGLQPMQIKLDWLPLKYSKQQVHKLFLAQFEDKYVDKESFLLSKNIINHFINKLPATEKHNEWLFSYYPDEGTKLFINGVKIHHLVGAELNRALLQSWLDKSPVLTANLFNRLLRIR